MFWNSLRNGRSKRTGLPIELVRHQERRNLHVPTFFRGGVHAATCLLLDSSLTATLVAPANCFCNILYICSFSMSWQIFTHKSSWGEGVKARILTIRPMQLYMDRNFRKTPLPIIAYCFCMDRSDSYHDSYTLLYGQKTSKHFSDHTHTMRLFREKSLLLYENL